MNNSVKAYGLSFRVSSSKYIGLKGCSVLKSDQLLTRSIRDETCYSYFVFKPRRSQSVAVLISPSPFPTRHKHKHKHNQAAADIIKISPSKFGWI
jgi:hypothetical protein